MQYKFWDSIMWRNGLEGAGKKKTNIKRHKKKLK
jgi:hypothetical protein